MNKKLIKNKAFVCISALALVAWFFYMAQDQNVNESLILILSDEHLSQVIKPSEQTQVRHLVPNESQVKKGQQVAVLYEKKESEQDQKIVTSEVDGIYYHSNNKAGLIAANVFTESDLNMMYFWVIEGNSESWQIDDFATINFENNQVKVRIKLKISLKKKGSEEYKTKLGISFLDHEKLLIAPYKKIHVNPI